MAERGNIYGLDAMDFLDEDAIPDLMKRAMGGLLLDFQEGRRPSPGSLEDRYRAAFDIISAAFGRDFGYLDEAALRKGAIKLSSKGQTRARTIRRDDAKKRRERHQSGKAKRKPPRARIRMVDKAMRQLRKSRVLEGLE